jgi:hypothetical protein
VNEAIAFRIDPGKEHGADESRGSLTLVFGGKSRPVVRGSVVEIPPLEDAGVYELRDGEHSIGRFAVNFHDPEESTLTSLGPGVREPIEEGISLGYLLDDPFSWLIAGGIVLIVVTVFGDWWVLGERGKAKGKR